jgi:adenylyl-sulfate kinase
MSSPGLVVWCTGLSSSGKTTICTELHARLASRGFPVVLLDGDEIRKHISKDLGFGKADRDENIHRIGFLAQLLSRSGVIALVSAISPYRAVRNEVRDSVTGFVEVHVNAPLEVCEERDRKGIYARARRGELRGVTGIDDPYEPPEHPEVECRTDLETVGESIAKVLAAIEPALNAMASVRSRAQGL